MAQRVEGNPLEAAYAALLAQGLDGAGEALRILVNEAAKIERSEYLGARPHERTPERRDHANGFKPKTMLTRMGEITFAVPQTRESGFYPSALEKGTRTEQALNLALAEMYVQGVSTRKVAAITEQLCGHEFSASAISTIVARLDAQLDEFARRRLEEDYPYLVLDARYERVREGGVVRHRAVLVAIGITWDGRRSVIGVELANRESQTSWREFLTGLRERGLRGVEFVVSDNHAGLKAAIREVLTEAVWQRCYVHFLRNALEYLPRRGDDDCLKELRWLYDRRAIEEARADLRAWLLKWEPKYAKLCAWIEESIEETWSFYALPPGHRKHLKSTNMLERLNEEFKRRTHIVRIFPNEASCLRLIRALAAEQDEEWIEATRYLNMEELREQKRARLHAVA